MNFLVEELLIIMVLNLLLWGMILIVPPIVIRVKRIKYPKFTPWGLSVLNLIFVVREKESEPLIRHELAHVRQQQLFSPFGMAILMLVHYSWLFIRFRSSKLVYAHSVFERLANEAMSENGPLPNIFYIN